MKIQETAIQLVKEAAKRLKDSELKELATSETQSALESVRKVIGLGNVPQTLLFISLFERSCACRDSDLDDMANYFDCSLIDIVEYAPELDEMVRQGFIRVSNDNEEAMNRGYRVCDGVLNDIIQGKPVKVSAANLANEVDRYDFCGIISKAFESDSISLDRLLPIVLRREEEFGFLDFISDVRARIKKVEDRAWFYEMCNDFLMSDRRSCGTTELDTTLKDIYDRPSGRIACQKAFCDGTHPLMKEELVVFTDRDRGQMGLTEKGKKLLFGKDFFAITESYANLDRYEFAKAVEHYIDGDEFHKNQQGAMVQLAERVKLIEQENPQLKMIKTLSRMVSDPIDRTLFYLICDDCADGDSYNLSHELNQLFDAKDRNKQMMQFKNKTHILQKCELVKIEKKSELFGERTYLVCTEKGKQLYFEEDAVLYQEESDCTGILKVADIKEKHLFFGDELKSQLSMVLDSLQNDKFQLLQTRLADKALAKGVAVLMYGEPGTGKTESVMQMARATGRNILRVDISATKSAWFGESEKTIKKVFQDYQRLCQESEITPILLFNEADAVFSKRKDVMKGNVTQTENAIQNIILEEMEKLDGILIATTNLADNLDGAFERRFLFKIRFGKPGTEIKQHIWEDKMPTLLPQETQILAHSYDFSGGEIDNIVRKAMMSEVISGEKPNLEMLCNYCKEERIAKKSTSSVGF